MEGNKLINLREKAYNEIKKRIITCELEPGSLIVERELIEAIGVSRTPIREALNRLEQERLIRIYPKRGILVTNLSVKDVVDIYAMREINEPFAARLAARNIDTSALEPYRELWSDSEHEQRSDEHIALDRRFHHLIAEASGNRYLVGLLSTLYDQVNRIRFLSLLRIRERIEEIREEHLRLIECLCRRDEAGAESAMRIHMSRAKEAALKSFSGV